MNELDQLAGNLRDEEDEDEDEDDQQEAVQGTVDAPDVHEKVVEHVMNFFPQKQLQMLNYIIDYIYKIIQDDDDLESQGSGSFNGDQEDD